jgi:hypothetical protein
MKFTERIILDDLDINIRNRLNFIKLLSLIWNQLSTSVGNGAKILFKPTLTSSLVSEKHSIPSYADSSDSIDKTKSKGTLSIETNKYIKC